MIKLGKIEPYRSLGILKKKFQLITHLGDLCLLFEKKNINLHLEQTNKTTTVFENV